MHLRVLDGDESILTTAATVKSLQLDFILLFSARAYRPQLRNLASSGLWCLFLTDPQSFQSEVVGFWELYYDHDVSGAALVQLCDQTTGYFLRTGYFAIDRTCYGRGERAKLSSVIEWPASACRELQEGQKLCRPVAPLNWQCYRTVFPAACSWPGSASAWQETLWPSSCAISSLGFRGILELLAAGLRCCSTKRTACIPLR